MCSSETKTMTCIAENIGEARASTEEQNSALPSLKYIQFSVWSFRSTTMHSARFSRLEGYARSRRRTQYPSRCYTPQSLGLGRLYNSFLPPAFCNAASTFFLNSAPSGPGAVPLLRLTSSMISSTISSNVSPGAVGIPKVAPCLDLTVWSVEILNHQA